jgi:Zn ribbon nucleic-acid-binding protein
MHETTTGFEASISLPTTDDGFFGRCCPQCERRFTLESGRWNDDSSPPLTCCYCGFASNLDDFTTPEQEELIEAAIDAAVNAYIEQKVDEVFGGLRRHTSTNRFVRITIEPSRRLIPSLPEHVEAQARRVLVCGTCDSRYGVLGSAAFCPSCGPRHPAETLADAVLASRRALALEDALTDEGREQAQADGVLDDLAANAIKSVVSFFEAAIRANFTRRVPRADQILATEHGAVFQRLDDVARLYRDHLGVDPPNALGEELWQRLGQTFQQRHVLIHQHGHVDQKYVDRVPDSGLVAGQRLVISRSQAEQALTDLEDAVATLTGPP